MRIKYITTYGGINDSENRISFPSGKNKSDYICCSLNRISISVDIISVSSTNNKIGFYRSKKVKCNDHNTLKTNTTFGVLSKKLMFFQDLFSWLWLFFYLILNTKKGEYLLIYHGLNKIIPLLLAKKIKKLNYIIEVEEVFSELIKLPKWKNYLEIKMLESASKYIFASEFLNRKVNLRNKPFCIANGNLKVEEEVSSYFEDGKTHIVYAGIINRNKGAGTAVKVASYLPNNYHIHIIGYGNKQDVDELISQLPNSNNSFSAVTYDGLLKGEEYNEFIQSCHIGLCPQIVDDKYNNASFPSKITSYLSNGIRVVASKSSAIENSPLGKLIYFSKDDTPEEIAKTILKINLEEPYDSREIIKQLDNKFLNDLAKLF